MVTKRTAIVVAVLFTAIVSAGCFGPGEDAATTTEEGTETTPAETVEAGGDPTAQPAQTPTVFGTTTVQETANETETDGNATVETTTEAVEA
ncbi:hypothetical protein [Halorussus sp. MSC15.2]|uniref:hypothetical protein n=1 Tax=Halorussus sp. MSC15.2 TaxID=2283638 RepID=UPI0013D6BBC8|nr:hypothetical protein [Halorussus sp. MSC15.2]NEU58488.1 hypothetical protein [Halorussus sp. MSC15.2]